MYFSFAGEGEGEREKEHCQNKVNEKKKIDRNRVEGK